MSTRLNVNINETTGGQIRAYVERHDVTATEAVRRAFGVLALFDEAQSNGERITLTADDGSKREVRLI